MKIKIPNILTIGRIIIVPIFVLSFFIPGTIGDLVPFFLFIIASFTDFLDGLLARLYKEESKLGELLDPIADKILVSSALVLLVMNGIIKNYEVIAAIIILTREILISGLREFLAKSAVSMPVSNLAKFKTFIQMFSIAILLTGETGNKLINFQDYNAQTIGIVLLWLSAFLTLYTAYDYLVKGIDSAMNDKEMKWVMNLSEINRREKEFHDELHILNKRRFQNKFYKAVYNLYEDFFDILKKKVQSKDVLDYGCGIGNVAEKVINFKPKKLVAIDRKSVV